MLDRKLFPYKYMINNLDGLGWHLTDSAKRYYPLLDKEAIDAPEEIYNSFVPAVSYGQRVEFFHTYRKIKCWGTIISAKLDYYDGLYQMRYIVKPDNYGHGCEIKLD